MSRFRRWAWSPSGPQRLASVPTIPARGAAAGDRLVAAAPGLIFPVVAVDRRSSVLKLAHELCRMDRVTAAHSCKESDDVPRIRSTQPVRSVIVLLTICALGAAPLDSALHAQQTEQPDGARTFTLTLDEAIRLAERGSPSLRQVRNDEEAATWGLRAAWGRFLPGANVSGGMQYQAAGSSARFGIFTGEDLGINDVPSYYLSDYSIGLSLSLSRATLAGLDAARSETRAATEATRAEGAALRQAVTAGYLAVLRARDVVDLRQAELERAENTLALARARVEVGSATPIEAQQAEVARGRAEVALLRAQAGLEEARLQLLQTMGVGELPDGAESIRLTSTFRVFRPPWEEDRLLRESVAQQPHLATMRARADAGDAAVAEAKASYWPSLDISAGWSGYTREVGDPAYLIGRTEDQIESQTANCESYNVIASRLSPPLPTQDCSQFTMTPELEQQIVAQNEVFPFDFTPQPFSVRIGLSYPLFNGFSRQAAVARANAQAEDATEALRAERLRVTTEVKALLRRLRLEYRAAQLEEDNRSVAEAQLRQARERYRAGAVRLLDLTEAEALYVQAAQARLDAIYRFHETLARLELAVGRPLRDDAPGSADPDPSADRDPSNERTPPADEPGPRDATGPAQPTTEETRS